MGRLCFQLKFHRLRQNSTGFERSRSGTSEHHFDQQRKRPDAEKEIEQKFENLHDYLNNLPLVPGRNAPGEDMMECGKQFNEFIG